MAQKKIIFSGRVFSSDTTKAISRATVLLKHAAGVTAFAFTDEEGKYLFEKEISDTGEYILQVSNINYQPVEILFHIDSLFNNLHHVFYLVPLSKPMKDVVVKTVWKERQNEDTIEYNAGQYQTPQTRKVEDLLKNIDGFSVSSDGIITYRGKQVKAMLINGDDLTQDQYTLLSKNLNADVVDKIQVIDNYSSNRITGAFIKSNDVAVNLKLKGKLFGKVSGSYSVGYAPARRYDADVNMILLKKKITMLQLLAANNVSNNIAGNSFFENETSFSGIPLPATMEKKSFSFPATGGSINIPPLPLDYILHNTTRLVSTLFHVRVNKFIKLSAKLGMFNEERNNFSQALTKTIIDSNTRWEISNQGNWRLNNSGLITTVSVLHDNTKNFTGNANFQFTHLNRKNFFSSLTQIAVVDSLMEYSKSNVNLFSGNYSGAVKINAASALSYSVFYQRLPGQTFLDASTNRYAAYFNRRNNFDFFAQQTNYLFSVGGANISFLHKNNSASYKYSFAFQKESLKGSNNLKGGSNFPPSEVLMNSVGQSNSLQKGEFYFSGSYNLFRKTTFKLEGSTGGNIMKLKETAIKIPVWNFDITGMYKTKAFSYVSVSLVSVQKLPSIQLLFPDSSLSGNAVIQYGITDVQPIRHNEANASFSYFKFRTSTSILTNMWVRYGFQDYATRFFITPSFLQLKYVPVKNNLSKGILLSGKTLVYPLRSVISFSGYLQQDKIPGVVNGQEVLEKNVNFNYTVSLHTKFNIPINSELSFNQFFFKGSQSRQNQVLKVSNRFFTLENKYRVQINKKIYLGAQYNFLKFDATSHHLATVFASYKLSEKSSLDFKLHNLLNQLYFTRYAATNNTIYFQTFLMVPRYLLIRFNHSF